MVHPNRAPSIANARSLVAITALAPIAWGTTYFISTEMLPADRPLLAGALRALPAGLALAAITRIRPNGTWWIKAAVLGTLNIGAFFALLFVAAFRLPGGVAATLGAIQPLIATGLAASLLGERFSRTTLLSGILGIVGVGLLVLRGGGHLDGLGVAAGLLGAASMATGVVLTKRWGRPVPLLAFTSWQLVAGGLVLVPLALAVEGAPPAMTAANVAGFAWLATVGTALAYVVWFRGVRLLPVARVSILGLLSPLTAVLVGWIALGERPSIGQLAGMVIILVAIRLGQTAAARQPGPGTVNVPLQDRRGEGLDLAKRVGSCRVEDDLGRPRCGRGGDEFADRLGLANPTRMHEVVTGAVDEQLVTIGEVRAVSLVDSEMVLAVGPIDGNLGEPVIGAGDPGQRLGARACPHAVEHDDPPRPGGVERPG